MHRKNFLLQLRVQQRMSPSSRLLKDAMPNAFGADNGVNLAAHILIGAGIVDFGITDDRCPVLLGGLQGLRAPARRRSLCFAKSFVGVGLTQLLL
jgi:hypothetical protein